MVLSSETAQLQHLAWRAGFGENLPVIREQAAKRRKAVVKQLVNGPAGSKPPLMKVIDESELPDYRKKDMAPEEKKQLRQMNTQGIKDLNIVWLNAMARSEYPLLEKMSLFWHGHFACRTQNVLFNQQLLQVIRDHALGNFGKLLKAVSRSPAMLQFLNNQQNRRQHPNENFAREVMELFTTGRGHYTETDVKEAARAFTGWGFDAAGNFVFREKFHDNGLKTFLGKQGNFKGDDILNILLEQQETALFITQKIYRFFVDDTAADEPRIRQLAAQFHQSGYDIRSLMENIFMADWFYEEKYAGNRIKSPVELLVGIRRAIPMDFEQEEVMLLFQRVLGQVLFYPPNVAGWPGGRSWIDSSSLMFRLRVPQIILYSQAFNMQAKEITPEMGEGANYKMTLQINQLLQKQYARKVNARINWAPYLQGYTNIPREELSAAIAGSLLGKHGPAQTSLLEKYADTSSRDNYIKTITIAAMSTPEYQLC